MDLEKNFPCRRVLKEKKQETRVADMWLIPCVMQSKKKERRKDRERPDQRGLIASDIN